MLTADQNIEFQQNLSTLPLAVLVLVADSNRLESLAPLVPALLEALTSLPFGHVDLRRTRPSDRIAQLFGVRRAISRAVSRAISRAWHRYARVGLTNERSDRRHVAS